MTTTSSKKTARAKALEVAADQLLDVIAKKSNSAIVALFKADLIVLEKLRAEIQEVRREIGGEVEVGALYQSLKAIDGAIESKQAALNKMMKRAARPAIRSVERRAKPRAATNGNGRRSPAKA